MVQIEFKEIQIHNEGKTVDLLVMDDKKNAENIIRSMFEEHYKISEGEFSKPSNEQTILSVKKRLSKFRKLLQGEFNLQSIPYEIRTDSS